MSDTEQNELARILRESGINPRVEGRTLYVTPADFAKLNRWARETFEIRTGDPIAEYKVVVER
jgi:hypothetical protein